MKKYCIKHKDISAAIVQFDEATGKLEEIVEVLDERHLPLCAQNGNKDILAFWWSNRAVSKSQSEIKAILEREKIRTTQSFLLNNLGLSITDAFWVCPEGADIAWKDISFHLNSFKSNIMNLTTHQNDFEIPDGFTPVASTGGELRKQWIKVKGKIHLIKGNISGYYFQQSLNEVFASKIHEKQNRADYVPYSLIKLKDNSIGCICPCFTSEQIEFIPAWELFSKYKRETKKSLFDFFSICAEREGCDGFQVRDYLDYMFLTDYLVTNIDRHTNNFGILRYADSLEAFSPAPIFDTGNSMFYLGGGIGSYKDLFHTPISSIYSEEGSVLDNINNFKVLDITKLPSADYVEKFYQQDPVVAPSAKRLASYYEFKKNVIIALQRGKKRIEIESDLEKLFANKDERKDINSVWSKYHKREKEFSCKDNSKDR